MNEYKVVLVKNEYIPLIKKYKKCLNKLLLEERSMFDSKQLQLIFENSETIIGLMENDLFLRDDYSYFHGIHKIKNEVTDEVISFVINGYDIDVHESGKKHILYDYLCTFSQNFFMIKA